MKACSRAIVKDTEVAFASASSFTEGAAVDGAFNHFPRACLMVVL